jgi:ubiquinone/menaquinone biosynthesis C-methylase UbiE
MISEVTRDFERVQPSSGDPADLLEDLTRYRFAARFVAGQRVLDVACGTGYGSRLLLAAGARDLIGVDNAAEALVATRAEAPTCLLLRASAARLPLADRSIDVVVSLETVEHVDDAPGFVRELRRVLRPGGVAIVSTPRNQGLDRLRPVNPFHRREYSAEEFGVLMGESFTSIERWSQRTHYRDDLATPPAVAPLRRALTRLLPAPLRRALRAALGSRGLRPAQSDVVAGDLDDAAVQIAVCR